MTKVSACLFVFQQVQYLLLLTSVSVKEFASILANNNNNNNNNKLERHQLLKEEISKMKVTVVNEALGAVSKGFENRSAHEVGVNLEKSFIRNSTYH